MKQYPFSLPFKSFSSSWCYLQSSFHFAHVSWTIMSTSQISSLRPTPVWATCISNSTCPTGRILPTYKSALCLNLHHPPCCPEQIPPSVPPHFPRRQLPRAAPPSLRHISSSLSPCPQSPRRHECLVLLHCARRHRHRWLNPHVCFSSSLLVTELPIFSMAT